MKFWLMVESAAESDGFTCRISREVNWPAMPRVGDTVMLDPHNDHQHVVTEVLWNWDGTATVVFIGVPLGEVIRLSDPEDWGWEDLP